MSAFGTAGGGGDEFEEEEMPYEAPYEAQAEQVVGPVVPQPQLSSSPQSPPLPAGASKALSGQASEFDDEDDFSSPLHAQALATYAQAANVALTRPDPLQAQFNTAPPALTISNGRDVLSKLQPPANPLLSSASTGAVDPLSSSLLPSSASSLKPPFPAGGAAAGGGGSSGALPRIHTSPPTYDDSKTSLEALWAGQAATDPSLYTHAVYARQSHFGKGEVHVMDPEKKGDGITSYITYKVKSSIEHSVGNVSESLVHRRYSDFAWLHEHLFLSPQMAGFLIPPIPNKAVVGRFAEDFVEERRRSLEMFIKRIVAHPILREMEQTRVFLQGTDQAMTAARKARVRQTIPGLQAATQESGGVFSFFKSGAHSVSTVFSGNRAHERSPDDALCEKADDYALKLEAEMSQLEGHLEMLMKREKNVARTWVEMGMACGVISQMESAVNEKVNVSVFQVLGSMSDQVAVLIARKVELERQGFTDAVKDHIHMAQAVQTMMKLRQVVSNNYYEQLLKMEQLQKKSAKDPSSAARAIGDAQALLSVRQAELLECTNRARVEFGRFQKEKSKALKAAVVHFVRLQIEHAKQTQAAWENVLPDLEHLP